MYELVFFFTVIFVKLWSLVLICNNQLSLSIKKLQTTWTKKLRKACRETAVQMRLVCVNTFRIMIHRHSEIWLVIDKLK